MIAKGHLFVSVSELLEHMIITVASVTPMSSWRAHYTKELAIDHQYAVSRNKNHTDIKSNNKYLVRSYRVYL